MRVIYFSEYHFFKTPDGQIWTRGLHNYFWWQRFTNVFSSVLVVARVKKTESVPGYFQKASGENVAFHCLPDYFGPWRFFINRPEIDRRLSRIPFFGSAVIFRIPAIISPQFKKFLATYPYAVSLVGDPQDVFAKGVSRHVLQPLIRYYLVESTRNLCQDSSIISYVTKKALQKRYPQKKRRKNYFFSDIDLQDKDFAQIAKNYRRKSRWNLIFVGVFNQLYKGQDTLIRSMNLLEKNCGIFHLTLVGDGQYLEYCKSLARKLKIKNITFTGYLPKKKVIDQLRKSDIFILPTKAEGLPRALLEAMSQGLVCISSNVGGIPEILSSDQILNNPVPSSIADRLHSMIENPKKMNLLAKQNMKSAWNFREGRQQEKREVFFQAVKRQTEIYIRTLYQSEKPMVSVIMSAFNNEKHIEKAVNSILEQTYKNFEFIIIDDGSTDSTKEILKDFSRQDSRIKLICRKNNFGQKSFVRNLNYGLQIAKGRYIARMDADDISENRRFEKQIDFFLKHPETFLLATMARVIDKDGKTLFTRKIRSKNLNIDLVSRNLLVHSSIMFLNDKKTRYREKILYSQDYDLYLRLIAENKKISCLRVPLVKFRVYPISSSQNFKRERQILFSEKSREFHRQRVTFGQDEYEKFDPEKLLEIDADIVNSRIMLEYKIRNAIKKEDLKNAEKQFQKYFKIYGKNRQILFLRLMSRSRKRLVIFRFISKLFRLSSW